MVLYCTWWKHTLVWCEYELWAVDLSAFVLNLLWFFKLDSSSFSLHKGIFRGWGPKPLAQRIKQDGALLQGGWASRAALAPWCSSPQQGHAPGNGEMVQPCLAPALRSSHILLFLHRLVHVCAKTSRDWACNTSLSRAQLFKILSNWYF